MAEQPFIPLHKLKEYEAEARRAQGVAKALIDLLNAEIQRGGITENGVANILGHLVAYNVVAFTPGDVSAQHRNINRISHAAGLMLPEWNQRAARGKAVWDAQQAANPPGKKPN